MSKNERDTINLTDSSEIDFANIDELEARIARVMERGMLADRLNVELPGELYGEWVSDDPVEIFRMQAMGFKEDKEYATKYAIHSDGTNRAKVGDVVFMVAPRIVKQLIDKRHAILYEQTHGKKKTEEQKYAALIESQGTPVINTSKNTVVDNKDIALSLTPQITQ